MTTETSDAPAEARRHRLVRLLAEHEIWPMAVVVAASIATERVLPLALGVAAALIVARRVARGALSVRTPADWPILGLVLMACISLAVTARMDLTAPQVGRLLLGMAFYYGLVNWASRPDRLALVSLGLTLAGLALCLGAPLGVEWAVEKFSFIPPTLYERFVRLSADTINPNVMAGYLALLLPCALAPLLFSWRVLAAWRRALHSATAGAMLVVLVLTQSRAGLGAAAVALLVLSYLRWRRGWVLVAATTAVALALGRELVGLLGANVTAVALPLRLEVWSRGWFMVQDFAFTGIGMGSFPYVTERFYPLVLQPTLPHAHNLLLQVAVDLGVPGLAAWLAILVIVTSCAWRAYRGGLALGDMGLAGFAAGLLAAQSALIFHGMFDAVTWGLVRPSVLIWGVWGSAVAAQQVDGRAGRSSHASSEQ